MDELIAEMMAEEHSIVDQRVPALELSTKNVWVHHIKSVAITSEPHHVSRRESDKKNFRAFEVKMKRHL
jgi:hypothetical protein